MEKYGRIRSIIPIDVLDMKISVVIPAYNEERYIEGCLQSLYAQTEKANEIIVVDNNSTDDTAQLARQFGVKVIVEKKQGITYARNTGFNAAKYDIIARLDADTRVCCDWIQQIKHNFVHRPIDALGGPIFFYDNKFLTLINSWWWYVGLVRLVQRGETLIGANMALKRAIWEKIKKSVCSDDKMIHEDVDIALHILRSGGVIKWDNKLTAAVSSRRIIKNPTSFFTDYPIRLIRTLKRHYI